MRSKQKCREIARELVSKQVEMTGYDLINEVWLVDYLFWYQESELYIDTQDGFIRER